MIRAKLAVQGAPCERDDERSASDREDDYERCVRDARRSMRGESKDKVRGDAGKRQHRRREVTAFGQAAPLRSDGGSARSTSIVHSFTAAAMAATAASMG